MLSISHVSPNSFFFYTRNTISAKIKPCRRFRMTSRYLYRCVQCLLTLQISINDGSEYKYIISAVLNFLKPACFSSRIPSSSIYHSISSSETQKKPLPKRLLREVPLKLFGNRPGPQDYLSLRVYIPPGLENTHPNCFSTQSQNKLQKNP